jgi:O-methyltransferase
MHGRELLEAIVTRYPDSFPAVALLANFQHFEGLYEAVGKRWHNGWGSYLFDGQKYIYQPATLRKQEELYRYAMSATNALEIGVYLGHSLLIMLIANPTLQITCIDNDEQFARKAVDYLNREFGNRITFIHADALKGIDTLGDNTFDFVHIDADHYDEAVKNQFNASLRVAKLGATVVFDDYEAVRGTIDGFIRNGFLKHIITPGCLWTNCVTQLLSKTWVDAIQKVSKPFTALSSERLLNNINMMEYVNKSGIEGDVVEVGVYKGGSMLAFLKTYEHVAPPPPKRTFHLYDTFSGMTPPTDLDIDLNGYSANQLMQQNSNVKCISSLEEVQKNISNNTNVKDIEYHVGDILQNTVYPEKIAILRLDTDWYESTAFELANFYDKVVPGGVTIIDDYGHWMGCRRAVDEFLLTHPEITLTQIDYTGVYWLKPHST